MRHLTTAARVLLGLAFTAFAFNHFVPFLPAQPMPPPKALGFITAFVDSGFLTLVKAIELAAGLLLLGNRFVPLALTLLAPILVGIAAFHILLAPAGVGLVALLLALELGLAWAYRHAFCSMLHARVTPGAGAPPAGLPAAATPAA